MNGFLTPFDPGTMAKRDVASRLTGIDVAVIDRLIRSGVLKPERIKRELYIDLSDLERRQGRTNP